jgi:hypothetical protein
MVNIMLVSSSTPDNLWSEVILSSYHL